MATIHRFSEVIQGMNPVTVPAEQAGQVRAVSALLNKPGKKRPCQLLGPNGETLSVPDSLFSVLARAAEVLGRGDAITLVPVGRELTTQQAANVLNISRQYLVRLLEEGKVPFTKTGKHRRLKLSNVLAYRERRDQQSRAALDDLTQLSQDLGGLQGDRIGKCSRPPRMTRGISTSSLPP